MKEPAVPGWDDMRAFIAVARGGTLTEAADALGVSAATIGRRLQRLEASCGALFLRHPNRLVLSPLGRDLVEAGSLMEKGAAAMTRRVAAHAATRDAPVRVTATGSVSLFLAANARRLAEAAAAAGTVVAVTTTKVALDIAAGETEIALRMRRLPEGGPLAGRRVGRVAFAIYASRGRWEGLGCPEDDWRDLGYIGLTQTTRSPSQSWALDAIASRYGAPLRLRFGEVALRHCAVREGAGASLLPCFLGDADGELCRLHGPVDDLTEDVFLVIDERVRRRPAVRGVVGALAAIFRDSMAALGGADTPSVGDTAR